MFILMFSFVTFPSIISKYGIFNSTFAKIPPQNTGKYLLCVLLLFVRFPLSVSFSSTSQKKEMLLLEELAMFELTLSCSFVGITI